jgi:hypothetical protein
MTDDDPYHGTALELDPDRASRQAGCLSQAWQHRRILVREANIAVRQTPDDMENIRGFYGTIKEVEATVLGMLSEWSPDHRAN